MKANTLRSRHRRQFNIYTGKYESGYRALIVNEMHKKHKAGVSRRLDQHRRACESAYVVKAMRVRQMMGNHLPTPTPSFYSSVD